MDKMLSTNDIYRIIGHPVPTFLYDDLAGITRIENILPPFSDGECLILVRTGENVGHWVCLTEHNGTITFFDSYGGFVDDQLDHTNVPYYPNLSRLLSEYRGEVQYNPYQLQRMSPNVNTCGRWCALYIDNKNIPIDDFVDIMKLYKRYIDLDMLVTILTS